MEAEYQDLLLSLRGTLWVRVLKTSRIMLFVGAFRRVEQLDFDAPDISTLWPVAENVGCHWVKDAQDAGGALSVSGYTCSALFTKKGCRPPTFRNCQLLGQALKLNPPPQASASWGLAQMPST